MSSTSETDPINVDFVSLPDTVSGKLGMTFAPGKVQSYSKSGKSWQRSLKDDLARLNSAYSCTMLVSLMEKHEYEFVHITSIFDEAPEYNIELVHFPIRDINIPDEEEFDAYFQLITRIIQELKSGKTVVVHCMGGLGRTGTLVACVMQCLHQQMDPTAIIKLVRTARKGAIQSYKQICFVQDFRKNFNKQLQQ